MRSHTLARPSSTPGLVLAAVCLACQTSCSSTIGDRPAPGVTVQETPAATPLMQPTIEAIKETLRPYASQGPIPKPTDQLAPSEVTPVPTPEMPGFLRGDFLSGTTSSDCKLPCWQGLTVGESDLEDVQAVFHSVLGFDESVDILSLPLPEVSLAPPPSEGEIVVIQAWGLETDVPYREMAFRFDERTGVLEQLSFYFMSAVDPGLFPERIISELGTPSYILVYARQTEVGTIRSAKLEMVYEEGIVLIYPGLVPAERTANGDWLAEFCVQQTFHNPSSMTIVGPLTNGLDNLLSSQGRVIERDVGNVIPIEEAFGVTVDGFAQRVVEEEVACLYMEVSP